MASEKEQRPRTLRHPCQRLAHAIAQGSVSLSQEAPGKPTECRMILKRMPMNSRETYFFNPNVDLKLLVFMCVCVTVVLLSVAFVNACGKD